MAITKETAQDYIAGLPAERQEPMSKLRKVILDNLPEGFQEVMQGMPSYIVPLSLFPQGYHCTPNTPLPFMGIASAKNFISLHHFGMYMDEDLLQWFVAEYAKQVSTKLDMGKSCVRFKNMHRIPYDLVGELASKRTVDQWVTFYQSKLNPR